MISAIWFLIKITVLTSLMMWIISLSGTVSIKTGFYSFSTSLGIFIALVLLIIWILSIIFRAMSGLFHAPQNYKIYRNSNNQKKGLQSLAYGLSAIAAGDVKSATFYSARVTKYLIHDYGLKDLMNGLTARLKNDEPTANKYFNALLLHDETAFIGLKSLLQTAIEKGDFRYAEVLAKRTYDRHPKQIWITRVLFDLETRNKKYSSAFSLLKKSMKYKAFNKEEFMANKAALLFALGDIAKAYKANPPSLSLGLEYLKFLDAKSKNRKILNLIKHLWMLTPHPDLLEYWVKYAPEKTKNNPMKLASWIEDLNLLNQKDASSQLYCGDMLLKYGVRDQARRLIKNAIQLSMTHHSCQLMHQLDSIGGWLTQAIHAQPDKTWVCNKTGRCYNEWSILSPEGHFNTLEWLYPLLKQSLVKNKIINGLDIELV